MKRLTKSVKIDPEIWKRGKKLAIDTDMTMSEMIENLINDAIKKQEKRK